MNPWGYIGVGIICGVAGGVALGVAGTGAGSGAFLVALVLLAASGVLTLIGVIAEGVRVGMREVDLGQYDPAVHRVEQR